MKRLSVPGPLFLKSMRRTYELLKKKEYEHRRRSHLLHGNHSNVANSDWRMVPLIIFEAKKEGFMFTRSAPF